MCLSNSFLQVIANRMAEMKQTMLIVLLNCRVNETLVMSSKAFMIANRKCAGV